MLSGNKLIADNAPVVTVPDLGDEECQVSLAHVSVCFTFCAPRLFMLHYSHALRALFAALLDGLLAVLRHAQTQTHFRFRTLTPTLICSRNHSLAQVVITTQLREVASFVGSASQDRSTLVFDNDVYFAIFHRNSSFQAEFAASTYVPIVLPT